MIFSEEYKTVIEDFDKNGKLNLAGILRIFENLGNRHSDLAGDSVFKYDGNSNAWVLTEWQIEVDDFPLYSDKIKVETWSEGLKSPLVANRNYAMYKNGQLCVKGTTRWVLFDIKAQRLCKIEKELLDKYQPEDKSIFENSKLEKIPIPESFEVEKNIQMRRSDIDFNNHVHNLTYLDYALETLPEEEYKKEYKKLRITYKTAIKNGDEIKGRYAEIEGKKILLICDTSDNVKALISLS
ncbi:MAG: hypothetical protein K5829_12825 [Treponema sp.]|nr:hypothetical protein [Treponema sp.]